MGIFSAITDVVGGFLGKSEAKKNRQATKAENDRQYDLARNSIKYRTEDAKNAGIHPLYAMGSPTMSSSFATNSTDHSMSDAVKSGGRNLDRAISTTYEKQLQAKNLENINADINLKNAQTAGYVADLKNASNNARINQTGRKAGDSTALKIAGDTIKPNKNWSDAEKIEERYGDLVSWLYGIGVVGGDGVPHLEGKQTPRKKYKGPIENYGSSKNYNPRTVSKKWFQ